jgi:predicted aspartyl protease
MEPTTMGKVIVPAKIENLADRMAADQGDGAIAVRTVEVPDALIDTGATMLSMPSRLINALGLKRRRTRRARTAAGIRDFGVYDAVLLTVQGRDCILEVSEVPDDCPVLIGQVPLEMLDWVVDPGRQRLIGNPDHGGEQMFDLF